MWYQHDEPILEHKCDMLHYSDKGGFVEDSLGHGPPVASDISPLGFFYGVKCSEKI